jgi:membrane protein required for colicin V production
MTIYDALMLGIVVLGVIWGAWRGLISQVASLSSLILGYVIAEPASVHLAPYIPAEPIVARVSAMLIVYVMATIGIFFIAGLIRALIKTLRLGAVDRQLGMMLGAIEGAVIGLVCTLFVVSLAPDSREPIFASPTGRIVGRLMDSVGPALPDEARDVLSPFWDPDWQPGKGLLATFGQPGTTNREAPPDDDDTLDARGDRPTFEDESTTRRERRGISRRGEQGESDDARPRRR